MIKLLIYYLKNREYYYLDKYHHSKYTSSIDTQQELWTKVEEYRRKLTILTKIYKI